MKTLILGAGALGSIMAAYLTRAGEDVVLLARGARAEMLRTQGIRITGLEDFTQAVKVITNPADAREADYLVVTVKTYDTMPALAGVSHLQKTGVLSIQNGVYKNEQLLEHFRPEQVLGATAMFSGEVLEDGATRFTINEAFLIGELPAGVSPRVQVLTDALNRAGIRSVACDQVQSAEWSKFVLFVPSMALAALTRLETWKMMKDPDLARMIVVMRTEMTALAAKLGIALGDFGMARMKSVSALPMAEAVAEIRSNGEMMEARGATRHKISTLQDLERGRRIEVEETLGHAVRKARELDVSVPALEFAYRVLSGVNRHLN